MRWGLARCGLRRINPKWASSSFSCLVLIVRSRPQTHYTLVRLRTSHYVKDCRNVGQNSNGKVRFGFFRLEHSGNQPVCGAFKQVNCPTSLHLCREFGNERSHSSWLARFDREISFHFLRVCHNESTRHDAMVFKKLRLQNDYSRRCRIPPVLEAFPKSRNFVIASSCVLTPYSPTPPPTFPLVPKIQSVLLFKSICNVAPGKWNACQRDRTNWVLVLVTDLAVHT